MKFRDAFPPAELGRMQKIFEDACVAADVAPEDDAKRELLAARIVSLFKAGTKRPDGIARALHLQHDIVLEAPSEDVA